jgi:hypothetical protein
MRTDRGFSLEYGLTVSEKMLVAIGATVVRQASIEQSLAHLIILMLRLESDAGFALTVGMSFRVLLSTLDSLLLMRIDRQGPEYKKIRELVGALNSFEQFRNRIAHSMWGHAHDFNPDAGTRFRFGKSVPFEQVSLHQIKKELSIAAEASSKLTIFVRELIGNPVPTIDTTGA